MSLLSRNVSLFKHRHRALSSSVAAVSDGLCSLLHSKVDETTNRSRRQSSSSSRKSDHSRCLELVESRDREGFLCGLLLSSKSEIQQPYFAVRALNVELASIADSIDLRRQGSSSTLVPPAKIRIQWWREAIDAIYSDPQQNQPISNSTYINHPVLRSLASSNVKQKCNRRLLERLIDARELDLERMSSSPRFTTVQDLLNYAEHTASSLVYLSLEICDVTDDDAAFQVASHLGLAGGIVTALRSATTGDILSSIPSELLPDPNQAMDDKTLLCQAVYELSCMARTHLDEARRLQHDTPKKGWACFLPAVPAMLYLENVEKCGFDILHPDLSTYSSGVKLPLLLGRAWIMGHF